MPKPSVPEFTVSVTDYSYDVPTTTTTTTDPYDGHLKTTTNPGYHAVNGTITLSIKNQPFTSYYASNGYPIKLYYQIRAKGLDVNWLNLGYGAYSDTYFEATNSTYTIVSIGYTTNFFNWIGGLVAYKTDGTIDFQVEAFIGYKNVTNIHPWAIVTRPDDLRTEFVDQTSGWSGTQTATIPNGAYIPTTISPTVSSTQTTPTQTITQPPYQDTTTPPGTQTASGSVELSFNWVELVLVVIVGGVFVFLTAVIFFMRRRIKVLELKQNGV
jgi:hypothetical protein